MAASSQHCTLAPTAAELDCVVLPYQVSLCKNGDVLHPYPCRLEGEYIQLHELFEMTYNTTKTDSTSGARHHNQLSLFTTGQTFPQRGCRSESEDVFWDTSTTLEGYTTTFMVERWEPHPCHHRTKKKRSSLREGQGQGVLGGSLVNDYLNMVSKSIASPLSRVDLCKWLVTPSTNHVYWVGGDSPSIAAPRDLPSLLDPSQGFAP